MDRLNKELQEARVELGQISREGERTFATEKDERTSETVLSIGDRIQFTASEKDRAQGFDLRNGEFATVLGIEGDRLRVHTNAGRIFAFDASEHRGFALGYAGTTYKGQGKTNETTILFYDNAQAWRARGAYENLTRHKENMRLVVPSALAPSRKELARQMAREDGRKAASAYKIAPERPKQAEPKLSPQLAEDIRKAREVSRMHRDIAQMRERAAQQRAQAKEQEAARQREAELKQQQEKEQAQKLSRSYSRDFGL